MFLIAAIASIAQAIPFAEPVTVTEVSTVTVSYYGEGADAATVTAAPLLFARASSPSQGSKSSVASSVSQSSQGSCFTSIETTSTQTCYFVTQYNTHTGCYTSVASSVSQASQQSQASSPASPSS